MLFNVSVFARATNILVLNKSFYRYRFNIASVTHQQSYNIQKNRENFLTELNSRLARNVSSVSYKSLMQNKLLSAWIENSVKQIIDGENDALIGSLRSYFLPKIDTKTIFFNKLPLTSKIIVVLMVFKMYGIIRVITGFKNDTDKDIRTFTKI